MERLALNTNVDWYERIQTLGSLGRLCWLLLLLLLLLRLLAHAHLCKLLRHTSNSTLEHRSGTLGRIGRLRRLVAGWSAVTRLSVRCLRCLSGYISIGRLWIAHLGLRNSLLRLLRVAVGSWLHTGDCTGSRGLACIGTGTEVECLARIGSLLLCWCGTGNRWCGGLLVVGGLRGAIVLLCYLLAILRRVLVSLWRIAGHGASNETEAVCARTLSRYDGDWRLQPRCDVSGPGSRMQGLVVKSGIVYCTTPARTRGLRLGVL